MMKHTTKTGGTQSDDGDHPEWQRHCRRFEIDASITPTSDAAFPSS
jgi:hypothetical protein